MAQTWPRDSDTTFEVKRSKVKVTGAGAYCGGLPYSLFSIANKLNENHHCTNE